MHIANSIIWLLSVGRKCKLKTELHADAACDRRFVGHFQRWWKSFIKRVSTGKKIHYYCTNYKSVLLLRLFPPPLSQSPWTFQHLQNCNKSLRALDIATISISLHSSARRARSQNLVDIIHHSEISAFDVCKDGKGDECCQCHSGKCHFPAKKTNNHMMIQ